MYEFNTPFNFWKQLSLNTLNSVKTFIESPINAANSFSGQMSTWPWESSTLLAPSVHRVKEHCIYYVIEQLKETALNSFILSIYINLWALAQGRAVTSCSPTDFKQLEQKYIPTALQIIHPQERLRTPWLFGSWTRNDLLLVAIQWVKTPDFSTV